MSDVERRMLAAMQAAPRIDTAEELRLARAAKAGDQDAARELFAANSRSLATLAKTFCRRWRGADLGELVSAGYEGMAAALQGFDPDRGLRFVTYAAWWMRWYMRQHIETSSHGVTGDHGVGLVMANRLRRAERESTTALGTHSGDAFDAMVAARIDRSVESLNDLRARIGARDASLDEPTSGNIDNVVTLHDVTADDSPRPDDVLAERDVVTHVRALVATAGMTEKERYLVQRRWLEDDDATLADVGAEMGVSKQRAQQIEASAMEKLRDAAGVTRSSPSSPLHRFLSAVGSRT